MEGLMVSGGEGGGKEGGREKDTREPNINVLLIPWNIGLYII